MDLSPQHSGHTSQNTKLGWKPLPAPGDISIHLPVPSGADPALLHAWHPARAANHKEFQILPRHLAQTPHPTSSCALSVSQHPGSSFPRKRSFPSHSIPCGTHGYRDRQQVLTILRLQAGFGFTCRGREKGKHPPKYLQERLCDTAR